MIKVPRRSNQICNTERFWPDVLLPTKKKKKVKIIDIIAEVDIEPITRSNHERQITITDDHNQNIRSDDYKLNSWATWYKKYEWGFWYKDKLYLQWWMMKTKL